MKFDEREIQQYIWENREKIGEMIHEPQWPEEPQKAASEFAPWELLYHHVMKQYKQNVESIAHIELWGCEVTFRGENEGIMRTDFLGSLEGTNGLVICELKVNKVPERQAYTELLAYANHIRGKFAPMGRKDIVYLLIAPMEERIVREATIHSLFYDQHNVVALIPHVGETIDTLYFEVWIPPMREFVIQAKTICQFENIDTFKVCWRGVGFWSPEGKGEEPSPEMKHRLNQVAAYAAQLMERDGINGFVFCSQSYPEIREAGWMENAITICGINPYKAAKTKLLYEHGENLKAAGEISTQYLSLRNVIPSLKAEVVDDEEYWWNLSVVWSSCLDEIAFEVQKFVNLNNCGVCTDRDRGSFSWKDYLYNSDEDRGCWNYDIFLTGLLREMYSLKIKKYYDHGDEYERGELADYAIDMLNSQLYVRNFLSELAKEIDAEDDVIEEPDKAELIVSEEISKWEAPDFGALGMETPNFDVETVSLDI